MPSPEDSSKQLSYSPGERRHRFNVLLVVVDDLSARHLPFYGYGRDTEPTATVHLRANSTTAKQGFAAVFAVVQKGKPSPPSIDQIERLPNGRVRLHVSAESGNRLLTTRAFGNE